MKPFFGYIRVSTAKQGQQGVSLPEQREAILRHASKSGLNIISWFEERETAAKRGRPVFGRMLKSLRQGKAAGVVLHKIDRGARNLKDWADLAELIDAGIEVHFANESLDMQSRGGRLSADIQAVVAADYIRNLREETKKGFYGRLKQGLYPLNAPIGYNDMGGGKPKELDPLMAPLVRKAFELYATSRFNLDSLNAELCRLGLRNKRGGSVSRNGLSVILNNPFYIGLIRLKKTGELFPGVHRPIIPKSLFDRVQLVLAGKTNTRPHKRDFLFRRLFSCRQCGYTLIGERQKGHNYYRCHTPDCPTTGIREEAIDAAIQEQFKRLRLSDRERAYLEQQMKRLRAEWSNSQEEGATVLNLRLGQIKNRLNRLTDAFLDATIERSLFEQRKIALLMEQKEVEENMAKLRGDDRSVPDRLSEFLELVESPWLSYQSGLVEEKRDVVKTLTSNREVDGKYPLVKLSFPFDEIANRYSVLSGPPEQDIPRTWNHLLDVLVTAAVHGRLPDMEPLRAFQPCTSKHEIVLSE